MNTFGYDMVYAMRFTEANRQLQAAFDTTNQHKATIGQALAGQLGGGFRPADSSQANILAVVSSGGHSYTQVPQVRIASPEDGLPANTTARPLLRLQRLQLAQPKDYATPPQLTIALPAGETVQRQAQVAAAFDQVARVEVTASGSDYSDSTPPAIRFQGGGGTGATAVAVVQGGQVTAIQVTNPGQGYQSAPQVIIDSSAFGETATATAHLGLSLVITDPGSGYTAVPQVLLNGEAGLVNVWMEVEEVVFARQNAQLPHDQFAFPPALTFSADAQAGTGAMAFTLLAVQQPGLHYQPAQTPVAFLLALFQAAAVAWVAQLNALYTLKLNLQPDWQTTLGNQLATRSSKIEQDTSPTLHQYMEALSGEIFAYLLTVCVPYPFEHELAILQKAQQDTSSTYMTEARFILDSYKLTTLAEGIDFFLKEEQRKAGFRVQKALRAIDATLVFAYEQDPGTAAAPSPAYFLPLTYALPLDAAGQQKAVATVLEVVKALTPETQSAQLVALGRQFKSTTERFQKINLRLGAWQLLTGGDSLLLHLKIPIQGGLLYLGETATELKPQHKLYIRVKLQLAWLRRARTTTLTLQGSEAIQVLGLEAEAGAADIPLLTDELREALLWCVRNTLNKNKYKAGEPYHLLTPIDYSFTYNHSLAALDLYESVADAQPEFAWLYPTSVSYAVKDEFSDLPDIANSIIGICCMSEGRQNNNVPDIDLQAIPAQAKTAILLSREIVLAKFVLPHFVKLFQFGGQEAGVAHFLPLQNGQAPAPSGPAPRLLYTNSVELTTTALNVMSPSKPTDQLVGTVRPGAAQLRIDEGAIRLSINDVEYQYQLPGESEATPVKVSNELAFTFLLREEKGVKSLSLIPTAVGFTYRPTYKTLETSVKDYVIGVLIEFGTILATNLIFGLGATTFDRLRVNKKPINVGSGTKQLVKEGITGSLEPKTQTIELTKVPAEQVNGQELIESYTKSNPDNSQISLLPEKIQQISGNDSLSVYEMEGQSPQLPGQILTARLSVDTKAVRPSTQIESVTKKDGSPVTAAEEESVSRLIVTKNLGQQLVEKATQTERLPIDPNPGKPLPGDQSAEPSTARMDPKTWGDFWRRRYQNMRSEQFSLVGVASLVGAAIGGYFVLAYGTRANQQYEEYKNNLSRKMDNNSGNGVNFLAQALLKNVRWPAFAGKSLELSHFYLDSSLVIGLSPVTPRRRVLQGYASPLNAHVALAKFDADTTSIDVANTGGSALKLVFVQNQEPYQGHMGQEVGTAVTVPAYQNQTVPVSAFHLPSYEGAALTVRAEDNETTFTLTFN